MGLGLHEHFNGVQLLKNHQVAYKPFHNQLRKTAFAVLMKAARHSAFPSGIEQYK